MSNQFQFKPTLLDIGLIVVVNGEKETFLWEKTGYTNRDQAIGEVKYLNKKYSPSDNAFHFTTLVRGFQPIQEVPFEGEANAKAIEGFVIPRDTEEYAEEYLEPYTPEDQAWIEHGGDDDGLDSIDYGPHPF